MPSEHSSKQYELDLEAIRSKVLLMGGMVEKQFHDAIACFRSLNPVEADRIIAADVEVNQMEVVAASDSAAAERLRMKKS